jgi:hypothetical protein
MCHRSHSLLLNVDDVREAEIVKRAKQLNCVDQGRHENIDIFPLTPALKKL